ncbi:hypothetical protein ACJZ2D_012686 [Fusarium nematophilum]
MAGCNYNCSSQPTEVGPYGDIAGIGVITASVGTPWMVNVLLVGYYLTAFNPELDPFREQDHKTPCQHPNSIDYTFLRLVRRVPCLRKVQCSEWSRSNELESALNKCVMTLSDIQIFTGIAILISGYSSLTCGLSAYHWKLVVYLSWLAAVTNFAALSFLRNHLSNNPDKRLWRVSLILLMLFSLVVAIGLTSHFDWSDGGSPEAAHFAICYFHEGLDMSTEAFQSMVLVVLLLCYGFCIRLAKMSRAFEGRIRRMSALCREKSTRRERANDAGTGEWDSRWGRGGFMGRARVLWLSFSLLWGTKRLFSTRIDGPAEEDDWTFGQILPLLLLLAPLAAILEHFSHRPGPNERMLRMARLAIINQLELEESREEQANIDIDLERICSAPYLGAFLLAAIAYVDIGLLSVAEHTTYGLLLLSVATNFLYSTTLQILWVVYILWIPKMGWSAPVRRTAHAIAFLSFTEISIAGFPPGFGITVSLVGLVYMYFTLAATFALHVRFRGSGKKKWLPVILPLHLVHIPAWDHLLYESTPLRDLLELRAPTVWPCIVCFGIGLAWFLVEWVMEAKRVSPERAVCLRIFLASCAVVPTAVGWILRQDTMPDVGSLTIWIMVCCGAWISMGMFISLFNPVLLDTRPTTAEPEVAM